MGTTAVWGQAVWGEAVWGSTGGSSGIDVLAQPGNAPPRIQITLSGIASDTVTLLRHDPSGAITPVRGAEGADLVAGAGIFYDEEMPYNKAVYYDVELPSGSISASSGLVTVVNSQAYLVHPFFPSLSIPLYMVTVDDDAYPSGTVMNVVPGRSDPIPIGSGARQTAQSGFEFRTVDDAGTQAALAILNNSDTLLLQVVYPFTTASLYRYVSTGQETVSRITKQFGDGRRKFTVPYTTVARPDGSVQAQRTCADVLAEGTWRDIFNKYKTLRGVLTGVAGT